MVIQVFWILEQNLSTNVLVDLLQAEAEVYTKPFLDALGDEYAAYCQGASSPFQLYNFIRIKNNMTIQFILIF